MLECEFGVRSKNSGRNPASFQFLVGVTLTDRLTRPPSRKPVATPLHAVVVFRHPGGAFAIHW